MPLQLDDLAALDGPQRATGDVQDGRQALPKQRPLPKEQAREATARDENEGPGEGGEDAHVRGGRTSAVTESSFSIRRATSTRRSPEERVRRASRNLGSRRRRASFASICRWSRT